jgi:hypothetical protein
MSLHESHQRPRGATDMSSAAVVNNYGTERHRAGDRPRDR